MGRDEVYTKEGRMIVDVLSELDTLRTDDLSFNLALLPDQITKEAIEADKYMRAYQSGSFQFNNKQWLVQKVNYKLSNINLLQFFSEKKVLEGQDKVLDLIEELEKFMSSKEGGLYIDASAIGIGEGIGSMIIDLLSNYIINYKKKDDIGFIMFIDEVHRYSKDVHSGGFQTGLTAIAREGRKKGVFLFLTTQNPNDVPNELLGQIGTLLIHRLTHRNELDSIRNYLTDNSFKQVPKLNQGEAILTSINLLKELHLKVEKCTRTHKNDTTKL